ncbi:MAG: hypothetical protein WCT22_02880 [Patescibacteria group bacterium]|jgi:hypothetical protein
MDVSEDLILELKNITKAIEYAASKIERLSIFGLPQSNNHHVTMKEELKEQEKLELEEKKIRIDEDQIKELIKQNQILKITLWVTATATILGALPTILKLFKIM